MSVRSGIRHVELSAPRAPVTQARIEYRERSVLDLVYRTEIEPCGPYDAGQSLTHADQSQCGGDAQHTANVNRGRVIMLLNRYREDVRVHLRSESNGRDARLASRSTRALCHAPVTAVGKKVAIVVPRPGTLSARTRPAWASARCLTMARPRPVPPASRERAASAR